jgi:hypothetical protein
MSTYCVYHLIHVRTPHQHLPKLLIADVPEGEEVTEELLERAGFSFGEFGVNWANHVLTEVNAQDSPSDLIARIRQGEGDRIDYADLKARAEAPL